MEFKVGDMVVMLTTGMSYKKGDIGIVTRVDEDRLHAITIDIGDGKTDITFVHESNMKIINNIPSSGAEISEPVSSERGLRYNNGKAELHQVPSSLSFAVAKTLMYGAQKYEKGNWRKGMSWMTVYDCLQRHMLKWLDGEQVDEESGLPHLYHAACNVAFLIEYSNTCPELDDRQIGKIHSAVDSFEAIKYNDYKKGD